ncbi:DUF763 domain-containing protein [Vulcanisaeta souniana]|uniref:DUF763 domain-containing protein n=1 Tax=Vulcanisaeta souniana JCM 11219 TaxID=1293586 RepID=A0A830E3R7_9CREN|nr:DUF763 domain-containing protein [Vulcanisaeta souniana]BDR93306.1 hypothetical protein Vsou_23990 [Vulcanisaeta souniana JCM 11219]GGI79087.1 hypothetical protein GCM10007112_15060 [Vulcanisaeta souniana JCM 11219]
MGVSGIADLPLHGGHVPPWLYSRMVKLSGLIAELLVDKHGIKDTIRLFSNPLFFQAFNNIIGMDWDSSGSTTITTAALKEALSKKDVGIRVVGGKGVYALNAPAEINELSRTWDVDVDSLKFVSRLSAKIDNTALQDGYRLYHHAMLVGSDGTWTVIQQGLNEKIRYARRYHIWMENDLVNEPHTGIVGVKGNHALNMVSRASGDARNAVLDIVHQDPNKVVRDWAVIKAMMKGNTTILTYLGREPPKYYNPYLSGSFRPYLASLNEDALRQARNVNDFKDLLLIRGLGPSTMLALALIAELIYRDPVDWEDPANIDPRRYAFALGGKDGSPYPVNKEVYDTVIDIVQAIVDRARRDSGLTIYLRHLAKVARQLNLPTDLVRPTPP